MKLWTVLMIAAVIASAMAVLFVLHAGTDNSSAEVVDSGECGPSSNYAYCSDGTLTITGSGDMYDYTSQHAPWFKYREEITKVVISNNITHLGKSAFAYCCQIRELTIPITLNSVGSCYSDIVFAGCCNIEKVNFIAGTDGYGHDYAAYEGTDSWYKNTPWYQSRGALKEINFGCGIKKIGSDAFRELNITTLVLPENIEELGAHSFYNCKELRELTIPISLNAVWLDQYPAFDGVTGLTKITFTPGTGYGFNYHALEVINCWYKHTPWYQSKDVLTDIVFNDGIERIGTYAFCDMNITTLVLPDSLNELSGNSFCNCKELRELTLPISLNAVWLDQYPAFDGVTGLTKITFTPGSGYGYNYAEYEDINCWYKHTPWYQSKDVLTDIVFKEGIKHIGTDAFRELNITHLEIPNSIVSLDNFSFFNCDYLTELTIPITLDSIYNAKYPAFEGCCSISKLTFTAGIDGIGFDYVADSIFWLTPWYKSKDVLTDLIFEEGIKHIGSYAFRELNITSLTIPNSVTSLGEYTFCQCSKLTELTFPISLDCVSSVNQPAFDGCYGITKLRITVGTNGVGVNYFQAAPIWCTPLHKAGFMLFDKGITYIGINTFDGYSFVGSDDKYLYPTATNLSGYEFTAGYGGVMYRIDKNLNVDDEFADGKFIDGRYVNNILIEDCKFIDDGRYVNNILVVDGRFVDEGKFFDGRFTELDSICDEIPIINLDSIIAPVSTGVLC